MTPRQALENIKKVLKHIGKITVWEDDGVLEDCYQIKEYYGYYNIKESLKRLEELEKEKKAMKVIQSSCMPLCPNCYSDKIQHSEYGNKYKCCPDCGQKLDWREEE